jgi:hypothetical protein
MNKNTDNLHDLTDFAVAQAVVEDFPKIMLMYDKLLPALDKYQHYLAVASVIIAVEEARTLMDMQFSQFKKIHESKGKVNGE